MFVANAGFDIATFLPSDFISFTVSGTSVLLAGISKKNRSDRTPSLLNSCRKYKRLPALSLNAKSVSVYYISIQISFSELRCDGIGIAKEYTYSPHLFIGDRTPDTVLIT